MKSFLFFILIVFLFGPGQIANAQILNGDFEELDECPPFFDFELTIQGSMSSWIAVQGTADGYHISCNAIHPMNTPGVPEVEFGEGYGAVWGPAEVFGQELLNPLEPPKNYCLEFNALLSSVSTQIPPNNELCARICVYGSTVEPPPVTGGSPPEPVEEMPGTMLLGCSETILNTEEWELKTVNLSPDQEYSYLFFTTDQGEGCAFDAPYVALDNITIAECNILNTDNLEVEDVLLYPNPSSSRLYLDNLPKKLSSIEIQSISGVVLVERELSEIQSGLDLSELQNQMYWIVFKNKKGDIIGRRKFIKYF